MSFSQMKLFTGQWVISHCSILGNQQDIQTARETKQTSIVRGNKRLVHLRLLVKKL